MRRMVPVFALLVFFLLSCHTGTPPLISDRPGGIPSTSPGRQAGSQDRQRACHEVQRVRCAVEDCGANMDYVTFRCSDATQLNRCVISSNCG